MVLTAVSLVDRNMAGITNLADKIENLLPTELVDFMQVAGNVARGQKQSLYLVGGVVRDLLLEEANFDLDLVVEGDAMELAQRLAQSVQAKVTVHPRFNTAKLRWGEWSVDLATARSETYPKPGALPVVRPSSLNDDLFRRDFTINAMAVHLAPGHYGELIDLCGGKEDLEHRLLRVLHEKSFIDDATRIWRGLRYEQRLDFRLEPATLQLLKRDIPMLDVISSDRIRHELESTFREKCPERVLQRAHELSVLAELSPALKGNGWLAKRFERARELSRSDSSPIGLYLALLSYPLGVEENEQLISRLKLPKLCVQTLRDTHSLRGKLSLLAEAELAPSSIYSMLHNYSLPAITANLLATNVPVIRQRLRLFLNELRYVKPALSGADLKRMGIIDGHHIREALDLLRQAKLDGSVIAKWEEERLISNWLAK